MGEILRTNNAFIVAAATTPSTALLVWNTNLLSQSTANRLSFSMTMKKNNDRFQELLGKQSVWKFESTKIYIFNQSNYLNTYLLFNMSIRLVQRLFYTMSLHFDTINYLSKFI